MTIFKKAASARHGRRLFLAGVLAFLSLGASNAWAVGGPCSGGPYTFTLTLPATVTVPRDAPVGSVLTSWVQSSAPTNLWSCTTYSDNGITYAFAGPTFTTDSGVRAVSGGSYGNPVVYKTNIPGVGIALAGSVYTGLGCGGWGGWGRSTAGTRITLWGCGPQTASYSAGGVIAVALVKTASQVTAGGTVTGGPVAYIYPATSYSAGYQYTNLQAQYITTPVTIVPLSCTTPNVDVPLGTHRIAEFKGVGTTTNSVKFNFGVKGCPADLGRFGAAIQYKVEAVTTVLNSSQSVVALDSSSGAKGIGVQLLDGNGSVFPLNTYKTVSGYNASTGGSYSVPFQARYYQTASTVSPGKANSSMMVTMLYQ